MRPRLLLTIPFFLLLGATSSLALSWTVAALSSWSDDSFDIRTLPTPQRRAAGAPAWLVIDSLFSERIVRRIASDGAEEWLDLFGKKDAPTRMATPRWALARSAWIHEDRATWITEEAAYGFPFRCLMTWCDMGDPSAPAPKERTRDAILLFTPTPVHVLPHSPQTTLLDHVLPTRIIWTGLALDSVFFALLWRLAPPLARRAAPVVKRRLRPLVLALVRLGASGTASTATLLALCTLLGAATSVAIAWDAARRPALNQSVRIFEPTLPPPPVAVATRIMHSTTWRSDRVQAFTGAFFNWEGPPPPSEPFPNQGWSRLDAASISAFPVQTVAEAAYGWPMRCMETWLERSLTPPQTDFVRHGVVLSGGRVNPSAASGSAFMTMLIQDASERPVLDRVLPLMPIWLGLAVDTALFAALWALLLVFSLRAILHRARKSFGLCPMCAYELLHQFSAGCPECGWNRAHAPARVAPEPEPRA